MASKKARLMKQSKRNERNAQLAAEKKASGKPKLSKYEAKRLRQGGFSPDA